MPEVRSARDLAERGATQLLKSLEGCVPGLAPPPEKKEKVCVGTPHARQDGFAPCTPVFVHRGWNGIPKDGSPWAVERLKVDAMMEQLLVPVVEEVSRANA